MDKNLSSKVKTQFTLQILAEKRVYIRTVCKPFHLEYTVAIMEEPARRTPVRLKHIIKPMPRIVITAVITNYLE